MNRQWGDKKVNSIEDLPMAIDPVNSSMKKQADEEEPLLLYETSSAGAFVHWPSFGFIVYVASPWTNEWMV